MELIYLLRSVSLQINYYDMKLPCLAQTSRLLKNLSCCFFQSAVAVKLVVLGFSGLFWKRQKERRSHHDRDHSSIHTMVFWIIEQED